MNEIQLKILNDLFTLVPEGTFSDIEELQEFIEDKGVFGDYLFLPHSWNNGMLEYWHLG